MVKLTGTKNVGGLLALCAAGIVALISSGQIHVPLPSPAHGKVIHLVSGDVLPWRPRPLQGEFAPNTRLRSAVRLFEGQVHGAESVAVRSNGDLALLDKYGNLYEAVASSSSSSSSSSGGGGGWQLQQQPVARLGAGRPLGYHFDDNGDMVICDSLKGLVKYDYSTAKVTLLASRVSDSSPIDPGSEITYANDLAIAADGKIYFTSCSDIVPARNSEGFYDTFKAWTLGMAQGLPQGRLLMYDPATKETVVLAKGFYYANGVALSADESYLVMAETDRIRLLKYWLEGPKAGTYEPLAENLPGPPDGVSTAPDGSFWVGLVSPIPPIAKLLRDPTIRALYVWLPTWLRPSLKKWGAVVKISGNDGSVLDFLMDPTGSHVSTVSAALEHGGKLFLGNLAGNHVSYVDLAGNAPRLAGNAAGNDHQQRRSPGVFAAAADLPPAAGDQGDCELCGLTGEKDVLEDEPAAAAAAEGEQPVASCNKDAAGATGIDHSLLDTVLLWMHGKVANNKVVVFSKSYCPYSHKAKRALLSLLAPEQMLVVEVDQLPQHDSGDIEADTLMDALAQVTGARTVPRVFIGNKFVGGGDDTARLAENGKLRKLLAEVGLLQQQQQPAAAAAAGSGDADDDEYADVEPGQPGVAAAEEPQTLLARVHSEDCDTTQRVLTARVAGGASPVVGLAAATASSVKVAVAAVGLKYIEDLPVTCWVLVEEAETKEATEAAVKALLAGSGGEEVSAAAASTPSAGIRFDVIKRNRLKRKIKAPGTWAALGSLIPFAQITKKAMIIDDGIDPTHNDLKNQMDRVNSVTYSRGTGNQPPGGVEARNAAHGSHVSGTAAGDWGGGDTRGIAGIAGPMKGQLVSCNVFGSSNGATDSDIAKCLAYAVSTKSHWAINLSLGGVGSISDDQFYQDAFKDFCSAGGIALIAAGNGETVNGQDRAVDVANAGNAQDGTEAEYPAYMAHYYPDCVIAIANIQEGDRLAPSSNYGMLVKLAAPGTDITSDVNSNGGGWAYDTWDGTSMATPHATGSVILLRNAFPQASAKQVVNCLVSSADKTVTPNRYGTISGGVLNLLAAYNCMKAIYGDPTGGGGGTTPIDCTAQSVPECVLASSGVAATAPCSTSQTAYCLAVGTTTCSYSYKGSSTTCSIGKCSGSAADCSASPPPPVDCTARMLPICVDTASGVASSSPCRTTESTYCELANSNTYCSYKYLGRSATCGTDGSRCSGSAPNCPAAPTDCSALMLPLCVNRRTGFFSTSPCRTTSTSYCERVSSSAYCSYSYLGSSTTCGTDGTKCNGQSADCPWGSGGGGSDAYCSDPPMVDGATWDESCATLSMPGDTCEATCDSSYDLYNGYDWGYDYGTVGYSIVCNDDGTWGEVQTVGDACGTSSGGGGDSSSVCSDCSANGLCSEDDGCICETSSNGDACTCAEDIGFTRIDYTPDGSTQTKSYCGWAMTFAATAYRVNRNTARSRLDFTVGPADWPMCVSDNDNIPEVVDSVEFVTETYDCPTGLTFAPLPASQRQLNVELCNRRTKLTSLIFEASSARRSARRASGKCRDMIVHTTDYMSYTIPVRIMN
ncbi:hypothetical protein OEZ85_000288 [Tetradesmus obliquus]|uniref:Glutaredoxin domain-containing protein n=1 Tax=Tetradesmus obliquus TaxID=3088 RepID=A0ABY8UPS6_TETOB|nr:hypothetical protein OEZ85_000288 [Tetradesmus obliquus]